MVPTAVPQTCAALHGLALPPQPDHSIPYTKANIAEAQLTTAIRLFFQDANPVPVYTFVCCARVRLTTLGDKLRVETVLHRFADMKGITLKDTASKYAAHTYANFMK